MPNEIQIVPPINGNGAGKQPNGNGAANKPDDDFDFGSDAQKEAVTKWVDATVKKVIELTREEAAIRYHEIDDDLLDLKGEYDPLVNKETGARLSDEITEKAAEFKIKPEKRLRDLYVSALKKQWEKELPLSSVLTGEKVGKKFMVNGGGVWMQIETEGIETLYVWRRICRSEIKPTAISCDTSPAINERHHYLITTHNGTTQSLGRQGRAARHAGQPCHQETLETEPPRYPHQRSA